MAFHNTGLKATICTFSTCLFATSAWAGPYSGGQFGLYGFFVFYYLGLPTIFILAMAKTIFWVKLAKEAGEESFIILKTGISIVSAIFEFLLSAFIIAGLTMLAHQYPLFAEVDSYTLWWALAGWSLFFVILGSFDIFKNRLLLKEFQSRHPDRIFPERASLAGAVALWVTLGILATFAAVLNYF